MEQSHMYTICVRIGGARTTAVSLTLLCLSRPFVLGSCGPLPETCGVCCVLSKTRTPLGCSEQTRKRRNEATDTIFKVLLSAERVADDFPSCYTFGRDLDTCFMCDPFSFIHIHPRNGTSLEGYNKRPPVSRREQQIGWTKRPT